MGCFSFKCKECKKPVNSTSFEGENVILFLLKDGEVIQQMQGDYDSYGRVFIDNTQDPSVQHGLRLSRQWEAAEPLDQETVRICGEETAIWHTVCHLMEKGNGHKFKKYFDWSTVKDLSDVDQFRAYEEFQKLPPVWEYGKGFEPKPGNGIAAIHTACYKGVPPTTKSDDDPDQGWGSLKKKHMKKA